MLKDLAGLHIRFRLPNVALTADIEKAFLQVGLRPEDRDATRFIWLKDTARGATEDNLQFLRFTRIPFGINASPFLLAATIDHHLRTHQTEFHENLRQSIYVDNIILGADNVQEAAKSYCQATETFQAIGMSLREWSCNEVQVVQSIPVEVQAKQPVVKVLGITWDQDSLRINGPSEIDTSRPTKRSILSAIATVFDPLGLFSPVVLGAKLLIQTLWKLELDWDDPLPEDLSEQWALLASEITKIRTVTIPRQVTVKGKKAIWHELHVFADASEKAYGAIAYVRFKGNSQATTSLIFAKSKVNPVRGEKWTVPRLEFLATVIASKIKRFLEQQLPFKIDAAVLWTDSEIAEQWIKTAPLLETDAEARARKLNKNDKLPAFVRSQVKKVTSAGWTEIRHVDGSQNPADIASRGAMVDCLYKSDLYWHGPSLLDSYEMQAEIAAPTQVVQIEKAPEPTEDEDKVPDGVVKVVDASRFNSFNRLLRVSAYVEKPRKAFRSRDEATLMIHPRDIWQVRTAWIKHEQQQHWPEVLRALHTKTNNSTVKDLGLYLNEEDVIRCKSRLQNADIAEDAKNPILLAKVSQLTEMIIRDHHVSLGHAGVGHTLSELRRAYWVPTARVAIKRMLRNCTICRRSDGGPYKLPEFPLLPAERVQRSRPFENVGIDYFGPLHVRSQDASEGKAYGLIFACLATRAIHLELTSDTSAVQFVDAFRRFFARRGQPAQIFSDNAPTFKLTDKVLRSAWEKVGQSEVTVDYFNAHPVQWHFIPERTPWHGGHYERLVGVVKRVLNKILGRTTLDHGQLATVFAEVEAIVNTRPLVFVGNDIETGHVLTPACFLGLEKPGIISVKKLATVPKDPTRHDLVTRWKATQNRVDEFWRTWNREYLLGLRERRQMNVDQPRTKSPWTPAVGDVVLLKNDGPRGTWKLGLIEELPPGKDGWIRMAKIKTTYRTPTGKFEVFRTRRSIGLLYPLETTPEEKD